MIFLRPDIFVLITTVIILTALILFEKKHWLPHFGIAMETSTVWNLISASQYGYNQEFFSIGSVSIFPLFAWTIGLFLIYLIYNALYKRGISSRFSFKGFPQQFLLYIALYWPILLAAETIGYHAFNIKNGAAAQYPGLPFCNCLHAPLWMQIAYLALGPIYFLLIHFTLDRTFEPAKTHGR